MVVRERSMHKPDELSQDSPNAPWSTNTKGRWVLLHAAARMKYSRSHWCVGFSWDLGCQVIAASHRERVAGAHLPFPDLGHIRAKGEGKFTFVPVGYRDRD